MASPFRDGARDITPILVGVVPFGTIAGVSAAAVGLPDPEAIAMSAVVFAGASQLAALALMAGGAPLLVILGTVALINLRFAMYSAALEPLLRGLGRGARVAAAYLLTDQAFALAAHRAREHPDEGPRLRFRYYLGVALPMWTVWMLSTTAGVLVGARLPERLELDFAIPLMFLALLVPAVRGRAGLVAAGVGGALALALAGLPYNLGLMAAALGGIAAGRAAEAWGERRAGEGAA